MLGLGLVIWILMVSFPFLLFAYIKLFVESDNKAVSIISSIFLWIFLFGLSFLWCVGDGLIEFY